jgi:hypothetical protein
MSLSVFPVFDKYSNAISIDRSYQGIFLFDMQIFFFESTTRLALTIMMGEAKLENAVPLFAEAEVLLTV